MYVNAAPRGYTYYAADGAQRHTRGAYLILASSGQERDPETGFETLYAAIRQVAMSQCGHFMMGYARVAGRVICVSGAFGSDSLPLDWDRLSVGDHHIADGREVQTRSLTYAESAPIRAHFVKLPTELSDRFWRDPNDGWTFGDYRGITAIAEAIAAYVKATELDASNARKRRA